MKYVLFRVGQEQYALPVDKVQSIETLPEIRPVPNSPEHVAGVTNLRGTIVTVLSLHSIFQIPETQTTNATRVLVTQSGAYIVDSAQDVVEIEEAEIDPWEGANPLVTGVWSRESELVLVLENVEGAEASASA